MNLNEANNALNLFYEQLNKHIQIDSSSELSKFVIANYPHEALNYLTQIGTFVLVIYFALIAFILYKLTWHMRYLYRFLISVVIFAIAVCIDLGISGANIMNLGHALAYGFKFGSIAALAGLAFATFYRPKGTDNTTTN